MASGGDGMEAVAGEFLWRDITAHLAAGRALGQQVSDEVPELLVGLGDMGTSMQRRGQVAAGMLVEDQRVGPEHRRKPLAGTTSLVPDFGQLGEVLGDLAFVPGDQDRFHVREVLVQRRSSDAGLGGDLRHRHRRQAMFGHQGRGGVQGGVAHRTPVRLNGLVP